MIATERAKAVEALFKAALERSPEHRDAFLAEVGTADPELCSEVKTLLAHLQAAHTFLEKPPIASSAVALASPATGALDANRLRGRRIGSYEILDLLAEGGMGVVYLARQDHPPRRVALKLLRPGLATPAMLRRFGHEAEVLGRLQHPGVAQILEAGTAETGYGPQPFFAMELIEGRRLTDYADMRQLNLRQRLELLEKVCEAVHYAHQKGVIHRDLKPANILVDAADQPKVLDFGIARVTDVDLQNATLSTGPGQLLGTIPYMSPEQVAGDPRELDTRSDIYTLGVIGYELLTGCLPYALEQKSLAEAVRAIAEDAPTRLSAIRRCLRGDLDTIFRKALEKDKNRRYTSAAAFSADLHRYLHDEPIAARAPTATYLLAKFARRHRGLTAGLGFAALSLIAGTIAASLYAVAARRSEAAARTAQSEALGQHRRAEVARDESESVTRFLEHMLAQANPKDFGQEVTVKQALDQAAQALGTQFPNSPLVQARLHWVMGVAYRWQGAYAQAEFHLTRALELRREQLGETHPDVAVTYGELGMVLKEEGDYRRAEACIRRALALQLPVLGEGHEDVGANRYHLAVVLQACGEYTEAEALFRQALQIARKEFGEEHRHVATCLSSLAEVRYQRGDYAEAEALARQSLAMRQKVLGEQHAEVALSLRRLGRALQARRDYPAAEALLRQALAIRQRAFGQRHPFVAESMSDLGLLQQAREDYPAAEELLRDALAMRKTLFGTEHPEVANSLNNLAELFAATGRLGDAERSFREALAMRRKVLGPAHPDVAATMNGLALTLLACGEYAEPEALLREALAIVSTRLGDRHPRAAEYLANLASVLYARAEYSECAASYHQALAIYETRGELDCPPAEAIRLRLAEVYPLLEEAEKIEQFGEHYHP